MNIAKELENTKEELNRLNLSELRQRWAKEWQQTPSKHISREMLIKRLVFQAKKKAAIGLTQVDPAVIDQALKDYKRNPKSDESKQTLKIGTKLVRIWKNEKHLVQVLKHGFEYNSKVYKSLSQIASTIAGTRWNGWLFFGLKKI